MRLSASLHRALRGIRRAADRIHVRPLAPHEVGLHRELRLRALHDAPDSFAERFEDAEAQPFAYWEELTGSVTEPGPHVMYLACRGKEVVGLTYGLVDREREHAGRVGGMWVDPAWRGRGVGRVLLQEVFTWARSRDFTTLGLWAPAHSPSALALYTHAGFHETGARREIPTNPALSIVAMEANVIR